MKGRAMRGLLACVSLALAGCTVLTGYADVVRERGISPSYRQALADWTRADTVYSQFETRVTIRATYRSPAFQDAYWREYSRLYDLTAAQERERAAVRQGLAADFIEFFFYAYVPDREANDFDLRNSVWTVYLLEGDGRRVAPAEIRRIHPVTAATETFFPYIHPYHGVCYSLKFPPAPAGEKAFAGPFRLVFTGVLGRVELAWERFS